MKGGSNPNNSGSNPNNSGSNDNSSSSIKKKSNMWEYILDVMSIVLLIVKIIFLIPLAGLIFYVISTILTLVKYILLKFILKGAKMIYKAKRLKFLFVDMPVNPITIIFGIGYLLVGVILFFLAFIISLFIGPLLRLFNYLLIITPLADKPAYGPAAANKSINAAAENNAGEASNAGSDNNAGSGSNAGNNTEAAANVKSNDGQ